jgi:shikimate dehydrogenase
MAGKNRTTEKGDGNDRNILILIGMPASGKTSLGKRVASALGMDFIDTDALIEKNEGATISDIFKSKGEEYFRTLETETLKSIAGRQGRPTVLSVGGGTPLREENRKLLREIGYVVFVDRPLYSIRRNAGNNDKRPLLKDEESLRKLYAERRPIYRKVSHRIVANAKHFRFVTEELCRIAVMRGIAYSYAVIGDPIEHSLSPQLHTEIFAELKSDGTYGKVRIAKEHLEKAMADLKQGNLKGINVTKPHKQEVVKYLDELKGEAVSSKSVNTIVRERDKLVGYNTDMEGLSLALKSRGRYFSGSKVTLLGTGGAAAAIAHKVASEGASELNVVGRSKAKSHKLSSGHEQELVTRNLDYSDELPKDTDILINATSLGMKGMDEDFEKFDFLDRLPKQALVVDLIYDPPQTKLLKAAEEKGLEFINGLPMLIFQGLLADELFLGKMLDKKELYGKYTKRREK